MSLSMKSLISWLVRDYDEILAARKVLQSVVYDESQYYEAEHREQALPYSEGEEGCRADEDVHVKKRPAHVDGGIFAQHQRQ